MTTHSLAEPAIFARRESEARSYCRSFDRVFTRAVGSTLFDRDGRGYIDFLAGCSSLNYGHNDPDMKEALIAHLAADGIAHGLDMFTDTKQAFLEAFEKHILLPRNLPHRLMMTGPTGTNAVEAALKLARKVTGRQNVVAFTNGFHGMTLGALALTGNASKRAGAGGAGLGDVTRMPYAGAFGAGVDTLAQVEMMLANPSSGIDAPAAFILELVQGEGGLTAASADWVRGLADLARRHGALLIVDDIQAGIGRTGGFFSFDGMGIEPDMITLAKSLSGFGLPMAALLVRPEHDIWKPAEHNGTFRGNTHAFVTARVTLEKFWADDAFAATVAEKADLLTGHLARIAAHLPGASLRGRGMMQGIDTGSGVRAAAICAESFRQGLIIETSGAEDEVVKVLAPLTTPVAQFEEGLAILEAAVLATGSQQIAAE
ncbi:diaminobutyrate--2-oxoglutarate transaminase [Plastorhodobacter daqingensis]|uniref:Diaminobutyrate--2-oxoglutarate transaminase n=1 Tax=Plastorhodobacter daqingensis TaxID=1387281 RepID=A0ABW2UM06_9RHOB